MEIKIDIYIKNIIIDRLHVIRDISVRICYILT